MATAIRDSNRVPVIIGVSSVDLKTPTLIRVNPETGALFIDPTSLDSRYVNVTGDTMTGNLNLQDNVNLYFNTAKTIGIRYDSDHGAIVYPSANTLLTEAGMEIYANTGADATGNYDPSILLNADGSIDLYATAQGNVADRTIELAASSGVAISPTGSVNTRAILKAENIATSPKTFQFPNFSGTFITSGNLTDITAVGALASSIIPATDSAIDLGSSTPKYFANAYIDKIYLNATAALDGVTAGKVTAIGEIKLDGTLASGVPQLTFPLTDYTTVNLYNRTGILTMGTGSDTTSRWLGFSLANMIAYGNLAFYPSTDSQGGIGRSDNYWLGGYFDKLYLNSTATLDGATAGVINTVGKIGKSTQTTTLAAGVTTVAITTDFLILTGDGGGNTLATITGGVSGQTLTILFVDALITITDTNAHTANTVDLSAAFTSADDTVLTLICDGTSWYEISRSAN